MLKSSYHTSSRFFVWGIARSGIHAISCWIYDAFAPHKLFLDDQLYGQEPTAGYHDEDSLLSYNHASPNHKMQYSGNFLQDWGQNNLLLVIFENHDLRCYIDDSWCNRTLLGTSHNTKHVLVLRSLHNHYASMISIKSRCRLAAETVKLLHSTVKRADGFPYTLWIDYAAEYFGLTNYLPQSTVKVYYDNWISDTYYRIRIAEELGFESDGCQYNHVPDYGGGSSFDGLLYEGKASCMKLCNRWEILSQQQQTALRKVIILDNRLVHYSSLLQKQFPL